MLRRATQSDAPMLGSLHVASWRETYSGIMPDEMLAALSVATRTAMWSEILGEADTFGGTAVFVAQDGSSLVGFGSCGRQRDQALADTGFGGEIGALYVLRAYQGQGIGRSILSALAGALSGAGHMAASLWVLRENAQARTFYEALGGEIVGEKTDGQSDSRLIEVAYGWRDLSRLIR